MWLRLMRVVLLTVDLAGSDEDGGGGEASRKVVMEMNSGVQWHGDSKRQTTPNDELQ